MVRARSGLGLGLVLAALLVHAQTPPSINFGVFPYVSPARLVEFQLPLKLEIERVLDRPVTVVTAPDFPSFIRRTDRGDYDIVLTAPHLGRLAERRYGYRRIACTVQTVQGVILVRRDSGIHGLRQLRGKTVAIAAHAAIIDQMAEQTLREHGLVDGVNIAFREAGTHDNAMFAPLRGEADASVTERLLWRQLGAPHQQQLRVVAVTPPAPGLVLMAHPRVDAADVERLHVAMLVFRDTPAGRAYFEQTGYLGFTAIEEGTMRRMDAYIRPFLLRR